MHVARATRCKRFRRAQHLLRAGHELSVYNRTREKAASLSGAVTIAGSPAEAVQDADALLTMLADDRR